MRFPPPIRFAAPLIALVFGLASTWFDYRLNLDLDLARHLAEMRRRADSSGSRLARASARLLAIGEVEALQARVELIPDVPSVELVGVVDAAGKVIADSSGVSRGKPMADTPLAPAAALINPGGQPVVEERDDSSAVVSAHPFHIGETELGWALAVFDRAEAIAAAQEDARTQLQWMASAMALLSFALWAVLHFAFAVRLGRLADRVTAFGEGRLDTPQLPEGDDEVGKLSSAFAAMAAKLREREAEQVRLEREVLEISEGERQRIGHDLHDGLGQQLTAASMATNALVIAAQTADAPALAERGEAIGQQLRNAIADTRALAHGLAPVALADDGLATALLALAENSSRSGTVRCVFESPEPARLASAEAAGHLYRIAQEAVANALKHAKASEIRIGLELRDGLLVLEIEDDGSGIEDGAARSDGIGLRVMQYRAKLISGTLEIGSAPAGGTRISCSVPASV